MSYIKMKILDVVENLEETGYDFDLVAKRLGMALREVKEFAHAFGDDTVNSKLEEFDAQD